MLGETKLIVGVASFIILFGMVSSFVVENHKIKLENTTAIGSWACTADMQICPNGRTVGRVPPYCQFASCVGEYNS